MYTLSFFLKKGRIMKKLKINKNLLKSSFNNDTNKKRKKEWILKYKLWEHNRQQMVFLIY